MRKLMALLLLACGGGSSETKTTNPPPAGGTGADATAPSSTSQTVDAGPPRASIDDQRDGFVRGCLAKLSAPDYCNCAFDQFRDVFKDADLSVKPSDAQMATVKERTLNACASKVTDDAVKQSFTSTCTEGEARKAAYCDCAWAGLRKKLQPADFLGDFKGPKFDEAKKTMATSCKGKLPDDLVKGEFMRGCTAQAPAQSKVCECAWKKLRAKGSAEEIAAGLVDIKPPDIESCKTTK